MENGINWLKEHKFEEVENKWVRNLEVMGNFKKIIVDGHGDEKLEFEQRKIQNVKIIVSYTTCEELSGWFAEVFVTNGFNLDKNEEPQCVSGRNMKIIISKTPKEAIELASNDLAKMLISCLRQVAKLTGKTLELSYNN